MEGFLDPEIYNADGCLIVEGVFYRLVLTTQDPSACRSSQTFIINFFVELFLKMLRERDQQAKIFHDDQVAIGHMLYSS